MATESIVALIISFIALIPQIMQWKKFRAEADAAHGDEAKKISEAWNMLNQPMLDRIEKLEQHVSELEGQKQKLETENEAKGNRITELEAKVEAQEKEIKELRKEIERLTANEIPTD